MEAKEARSLVTGDKLFLRDGVGRICKNAEVTFLAGPFEDTGTYGSKWVAIVRTENGFVKPYNLDELVVKPPVPQVGEMWVHRTDFNRSRYIDDVTERYVITKSDPGKPDVKAHLLPLADFVATFKKKNDGWL
jgi:hypothetical protein